MLDYDKSDKIGGYIYFYKNTTLIAVYNPFVGLVMNKNLAEAESKQYAESIFEMMRRNYYKANKDYISKQIKIASEYLINE